MRVDDLKMGDRVCVMHGSRNIEPVEVVRAEKLTSWAGVQRAGVRVRPVGKGKSAEYVITPAKIRPWGEWIRFSQLREDSMDHAAELKIQVSKLNLGMKRDSVHCTVRGDVWPVLRVEATGDKADRLLKFVRENFSGGNGGNGKS